MKIFSEIRNEVGKNKNYNLRSLGKVPAVIYYSGVSIPILFNESYVDEIIRCYYNGTSLFEISILDKNYFVILKDFYKHPFKKEILHFDFQKVNSDDYVNVKIFFRFLGEKTSIGIKQGGFLIKSKLFVIARCLVSKIPNYIDVDISNLSVNQSIFLNDLKIPDFLSIPILNKKNLNKVLLARIIGSRAIEQKDKNPDVKAK